MSFHIWLEYLLRFSHLVTGIAWIGSSFYFIWLDSHFLPLETPRHHVEGEVFMVHGGFYYQVEKKKIYPGEIPKTLHWFKWEATLTWITGFLLLINLYFLRGASLLIDPQIKVLTQCQAICFSLLILVMTWLIYDFLWNPDRVKSKKMSGSLSLIFYSVLIFWLTKTFSGRGAFILTGAVFGTAMLLNVWIRILPGQAKMLREAQSGQIPDYSVSIKSKTRSVHNTYFIFPVLFIMLSNHYPLIYNHPLNWLLLILLSVAGACTRHAMVTKNKIERWVLLPAIISLAALVFLTSAPPAMSEGSGHVEFVQIHTIMKTRCLSCHSTSPSDDIYKTPPNGIIFETEDQVRTRADKIYLHVVLAKSMPLANKTLMTDGERSIFAQWLRQEGY